MGAIETGGMAVRQLFPISTQSTAASRSRPHRATAAECSSEHCRGQKYLKLEGHPNLFGHIRVDRSTPPYPFHSSSRPFMLWRYVQIHGQELAVPATIWERLCLFLIVFHLFTAGSTVFCSYPLPAWGSALLACYPPPHPLRLGIQDWQLLH